MHNYQTSLFFLAPAICSLYLGDFCDLFSHLVNGFPLLFFWPMNKRFFTGTFWALCVSQPVFEPDVSYSFCFTLQYLRVFSTNFEIIFYKWSGGLILTAIEFSWAQAQSSWSTYWSTPEWVLTEEENITSGFQTKHCVCESKLK